MTGGGGGVGCPLVHFSFVETNLVCGPVVLSCIAINGPDEKFQNDLLISFLSMKIGNIEKFARGITLLEIHLMFSVISNILADISPPVDRLAPAPPPAPAAMPGVSSQQPGEWSIPGPRTRCS